MPTYTYRCENCDYHFDTVQRFDDPDPSTCPNCGHVNELVRVYKPVGVIFKGSGFYATDNKSASGISTNGSKPSSDGSKTESNSGTESSDAARGEKTETKPAKEEPSSSKSA